MGLTILICSLISHIVETNIHEVLIFLLLVTIVDKSKLKIWKGASFSLHVKLLKQIHIWLQWLPSIWGNVKTELRTVFLAQSTTDFLMLSNYKGIVDMLGSWYLNPFSFLSKHLSINISLMIMFPLVSFYDFCTIFT